MKHLGLCVTVQAEDADVFHFQLAEDEMKDAQRTKLVDSRAKGTAKGSPKETADSAVIYGPLSFFTLYLQL